MADLYQSREIPSLERDGRTVMSHADWTAARSSTGDRAQLGAVVIGGGPSALALLLAARRGGLLDDLLAADVKILERTELTGVGEIGNYAIRSDSLADNFLKPIEIEASPSLRSLLTLPPGRHINSQRGHPVDLSIVGNFLADIAAGLRQDLQDRHKDPFVTGITAMRADRQRDGSWVTACRGPDGNSVAYHSRAVVIATGAHQPMHRLQEQKVAGVPLLPRFAHKTMQSADFLGRLRAQKIAALLGDRIARKVAIVGSSHSAIASADMCLRDPCGGIFGPRAVTVLHRNPLHLTYASPEEALADGFAAFGPADICAHTGRVFPLGGFRCDSRNLLRRYWRLGGLAADERLYLLHLEASRYQEAEEILQQADLIVAALGYRPRALPLFDHTGERIQLLSDIGVGALVDKENRVLSAAGVPVAGVFAMGLAAGYPLAGAHGESSFTGQANGLALWQGDVGEHLVSNLLEFIGPK